MVNSNTKITIYTFRPKKIEKEGILWKVKERIVIMTMNDNSVYKLNIM